MGSKIEITTYFGKCTCCHRFAYLKPMWDKQEWNGVTESYAEMLLECFGLNTWYTKDQDLDQICEDCITKLRNAFQFKTQVLKIQDKLQNEAGEIKKNSTKVEYNGINEENYEENVEYIEYLDEDILDMNDEIEEREPQRRRRRRSADPEGCTDSEVLPTTRWPRKLPPDQRYQTYKQYSADDFRDCIDAIKTEEMTPKEASAYYKIPFKTIAAKIRAGILEEENPLPLTKTREFIEDIKQILTYTTATPFKSRLNHIVCAFCSTRCRGDDLRAHTVEEHPNRVTRVEAMLRPFYDNQMLKIDIQDLKCTICDIPALYWADMINHLTSKHNLILKQAKTNIIPYLLSDNIYCAVCNENFSTFMLVDSHMNKHYKNYSCADCGETFITLPRLKSHEKVHETGKYPCNLCSKVFLLKSYRRRHVFKVHKIKNKVYKCGHCDLSFGTETLRQKHTIASHVEKIKVINCEICGALFYFNTLYKKHLRRKHNVKNTCHTCGRMFENEYLLNEHKLRHSQVKEFECLVCKKCYVSQSCLNLHMKRHEN